MQMTRAKTIREITIACVMLLAIYHAGNAMLQSVKRQFFLHGQMNVLKANHLQSQEINKELRDGLANYRSSSGIERLARERLNMAGQNEIIIRIGK